MSKSERRFIYTVYFALFLFTFIFVIRATAWELKTEGRLTKECALCLADFAGCMDLNDKSHDGEGRDPKEYISNQLYCVRIAAHCGEENKCKTRVVLDK